MNSEDRWKEVKDEANEKESSGVPGAKLNSLNPFFYSKKKQHVKWSTQLVGKKTVESGWIESECRLWASKAPTSDETYIFYQGIEKKPGLHIIQDMWQIQKVKMDDTLLETVQGNLPLLRKRPPRRYILCEVPFITAATMGFDRTEMTLPGENAAETVCN